MRGILLGISLAISLSSYGQTVSKAAPGPIPLARYRISFKRGDPVAGLTGVWGTEVPALCANDGTAFLNMLVPAALDGQPIASAVRMSKVGPPLEVTVSVPLSGDAHEFRLDQVNDPHDVRLKGANVLDSEVVLLVIAAAENKRGKETISAANGTKRELDANLAERHDYFVIFDRQGNYEKKVQVEDIFGLYRFAQFSSGTFLVLGLDKQDHSPKLAMLNDDGTLLRYLEIPKNDAPKSMFGTLNGTGKGPAIYVAPAQLVPHGDSIIIVQNKSKFPLLEVSPGGAIRVIKSKLPSGVQIERLIPSDKNFYVRGDGPGDKMIYELNDRTGTVLRRFPVSDGEPGANVACIHDGEFISFEQVGGTLVRLVGTTESIVDAP